MDKVNQVLDFLGVHLEIERNKDVKYKPIDNGSNPKQDYERI